MTRRGCPYRPHRRGFTLIESVATVSMLAVLGSIVSFLILNSVDGYTDAATTAQVHAELSIAMDRAMREIRKIPLDAGAGGIAPDITSMSSTALQWEDTDGDSYQILKSGSVLQIEVDGGGLSTLLTDVTAFTVKIFDEDDGDLGSSCSADTCDPVRRVELEVTLQRNGVTESLRTKVFLRSTMSGS